jgi:hypothetical protein
MSTDRYTVRSYDMVAAEYAAEAAAMPERVATEMRLSLRSGDQRPAHRHFEGFRRTASREWF